MNDHLKAFTNQYIETALWASIDDDGDSLDDNHDFSSIAPEALNEMQDDCLKFVTENLESIEADEDNDFSDAGHDFFLTRNGHGAGFWDGDWSEPHATSLDEASKVFGESHLYVENDIIYIM